MSDELVIDLTNYKSKFGDRVPPGNYTVIIEDVESDVSKAQNPMVNMWLRIVGGDYDGSTIVDRLVDSENSKFRIVMFMQALGMPTARKRYKVNIRSWVGKRLMVAVADGEPYMNRVKSEVQGYMEAEGGASAAVTDLDDLVMADTPTNGLGEFAPETTSNPGNGATAVAVAPAAAAATTAPAEDLIEVGDIDLDQIDL